MIKGCSLSPASLCELVILECLGQMRPIHVPRVQYMLQRTGVVPKVTATQRPGETRTQSCCVGITILIYPRCPSVSVSLHRHSHLISTEVAFPLSFEWPSKEDKEADK